MSTLIKLHAADGSDPLFISPMAIDAISPGIDAAVGAGAVMDSGKVFAVAETADQIVGILGDGARVLSAAGGQA